MNYILGKGKGGQLNMLQYLGFFYADKRKLGKEEQRRKGKIKKGLGHTI